MKANYIVFREGLAGTAFYVSAGRWSNEFPDAELMARSAASRIAKESGAKACKANSYGMEG
jgi:hypothetical protein